MKTWRLYCEWEDGSTQVVWPEDIEDDLIARIEQAIFGELTEDEMYDTLLEEMEEE